MTKKGNWIPLDKNLAQEFKSIKGPFSMIEAMFSYSLDADNGRNGSISGYSKLWGWSRNKVRRFIKCIRTDEGHLRDRKRTYAGHPIHFIDKALWTKKDSRRTGRGQERDSKRYTTTNPNPKPKPNPKNNKDMSGCEPDVTVSSQKNLNYSKKIKEVFQYWKQSLNHPKARIDDKRKRFIKNRLQDGYSVDDLKTAVDGCLASPYHQGENQNSAVYDSIELICRDADHVDRFIKLAKDPNAKLLSANGRQARQNGQTWLQMRQAKRDAENEQ